MNVKRIKRICGVRGCKNTDVFAISKSKETGNSVIICKECLKDALKAIENCPEPEKKVKTERKPLFYHPELAVTTPSAADELPNSAEVIGTATEDKPISVTEDAGTITAPEPQGIADYGVKDDDGPAGVPITPKAEAPKPKNTAAKKK